jgi:hypothetical protein
MLHFVPNDVEANDSNDSDVCVCAYMYIYITVLNATFTSILCFVDISSYHDLFRLHVAVIVHHLCPTAYLPHSQSQILVIADHKSYQ